MDVSGSAVNSSPSIAAAPWPSLSPRWWWPVVRFEPDTCTTSTGPSTGEGARPACAGLVLEPLFGAATSRLQVVALLDTLRDTSGLDPTVGREWVLLLLWRLPDRTQTSESALERGDFRADTMAHKMGRPRSRISGEGEEMT